MGNRVIKFRGKRVDNSEWAYGFVAKIDCYENGKQYEETVIINQLRFDDRDYYVQEFIDADGVDTDNEGDVVLDPFMGIGSTGIACINTNRNFIGMELDNKYFEIARQRICDAQQKQRRLNNETLRD